MPSFTTLSRFVVLLFVGAIVVKGWKLYGPTTEQVKSAGVSAVEFVESAWKGGQPSSDDAGSKDNSGGAAPSFAKSSPQPTASPAGAPPSTGATLAQDNARTAPATTVQIDPIPAAQSPAAPPLQPAAPVATGNDDRVAVLLSRLEKLGAADPKLASWGSSGHLYRFCCQASLADSPLYKRHFESVASEPGAAVEQVVAQVEAWRTAQRGETTLR